jgi:putative membrane protein
MSHIHNSPHSPIHAIAVALILLAASSIYWRGWYRLRTELPNVLPAWRLAAFLGGVFSLWAAIGSPLAVLDHQLLTAHMLQHLLLMTVAAPLVLLSAPAITLLHGIPRHFELGVLRALVQIPNVGRIGHILTHPVLCWFAATITVIGWHVPALFEIGMRSEMWHAAEHSTFFAAGILFWWPIIRPWPSVAIWPQWFVPLYLFLATLPCDALSAYLAFCNSIVYPNYLFAHRLFGVSALADQECAGALMWVWVTFAYLAPAVAVTMRMLSPRARLLREEIV